MELKLAFCNLCKRRIPYIWERGKIEVIGRRPPLVNFLAAEGASYEYTSIKEDTVCIHCMQVIEEAVGPVILSLRKDYKPGK